MAAQVVDMPMAEREVPTADAIRVILEGPNRNLIFQHAARIVNAEGLTESTIEILDAITLNTKMRAFWVLEANPTGTNSTRQFLRLYTVPDLDPADANGVHGQVERLRVINAAVEYLRINVPSVPLEVRDFDNWLYRAFWESRGPMSQVAQQWITAGVHEQPPPRQVPVAPAAAPGHVGNQNQRQPFADGYRYVPPIRAEDIGFFDPSLPLEAGEKEGDTARRGKDTIYRDYYQYKARVHDFVRMKGALLVRDVLPVTYKGDAEGWYTNILTDIEKEALRTDDSEDLAAWFRLMDVQFKPRTGQAYNALREHKYTIQDIIDGRQPSTYLTYMARLARQADVPEETMLRYAYEGIHPDLRETLPPLASTVILSQLHANMEAKMNVWVDKYTKVGRARWGNTAPASSGNGADISKEIEKQVSRQLSHLKTTSYPTPNYRAAAPRRFRSNEYRLPNVYKTPFNKAANPTTQVAPRNRPSSTPPRPCFLCNKTGHWRSECPMNPHKAMNVMVNEATGDEEYDVAEEAYLAYTYGSVEERYSRMDDEQKAYYATIAENPDEEEEAGYGFFCQPIDVPAENAFLTRTMEEAPPQKELPIIRSRAGSPHLPGLAYKGSRYAQANVRFSLDGELVPICPDTGCSATIGERSFLERHAGTENFHRAEKPMIIQGITKLPLECWEYVTATLYVTGVDRQGKPAIAELCCEIYVVESLAPNVLLGTDVMKVQGIQINLEDNTWTIGACKGLRAPLKSVPRDPLAQGKPVSAVVTAARSVNIPAKTSRFVEFAERKGRNRVRLDCDYAFEPSVNFTSTLKGVSPMNHIIGAKGRHVLIRNWTNKDFLIPQKTRLGLITPWTITNSRKMSNAYAVLAETNNGAPLQKVVVDAEGEFERIQEMSLDNSNGPKMTDEEIISKLDIHPQAEGIRQQLKPFAKIWREGKGCVRQPAGEYLKIPLVEGWEAKLKTLSPRVYRLSPQDRQVVDDTFGRLHEEGKMEWVKEQNPFGWPVFVVYKGQGPARKGRVVVDIRGLNSISVLDAHPLPLKEDQIAAVQGCQFLTSMDMSASFYQFAAVPEDTAKLSVITHRGKEKLLTAVMGYVNSVAHVQRFAESHFRKWIGDCLQVYIDDWLVYSRTLEEHLEDLTKILEKACDLNLSMALAKTHIGYPSIIHLGSVVDGYGYSTPQEKIAALKDWDFPRTLKELENYIGSTNYLRQFVPYYAQIIAPLQRRKTEMLKSYRPKTNSGAAGDLPQDLMDIQQKTDNAYRKRLQGNAIDHPTREEIESFNALQSALGNPRFLAHHDVTIPLLIDVDASKERGYGVMVYQLAKDSFPLEQQLNAKEDPALLVKHKQTDVRPILFLSKQLTEAEMRYTATELELSVACWAIRKNRHLVDASPFTILVTDHSAALGISKATSLKTTNVDKLNLRLSRASQYLSQFPQLKVVHKPGRLHLIPDALSRLPNVADTKKKAKPQQPVALLVETSIKMEDHLRGRMIAAYQKDERYAPIYKEELVHVAGYTFKKEEGLMWIKYDGWTNLDEQNEWRLCVPKDLQKDVLALVHDDMGHMGYHRAFNHLNRCYYFPRLQHLLKAYIKHCPECLLAQTTRHARYGSLNPSEVPPTPYHTWVIDIFMGLPSERSKHRYNSVLSLTCKLSKEVALLPGLETWEAEDWGAVLYSEVVLKRRWGLPTKIISDRDRKFTSSLWQGIFKAANTRLAFATAHHSTTAGQAERTNQTAEIAIRFHISSLDPTRDWELWLPYLEMVVNNSTNATTGLPPHIVTKGFLPRMAFDVTIDTKDNKATMFIEARHRAVAAARDAMVFAAIQAKLRFDEKRQPISFEVGDKVLLCLHKGYKLPDRAWGHKYSLQRIGPYTITEKVGANAYRLQLPKLLKIHDVVSVTQLEAYPNEPDPFGRDQAFPTAVVTADGQEMEIDKIVHHDEVKVGRKKVRLYRVRFKGFGQEHDEYIPEEELPNAKEAIAEYEKTLKEGK